MSTTVNNIQAPPPVRWHVGKEIPIALIVGLVIQALGLVWWTSYWTTSLDNRVSMAEKAISNNSDRINAMAADRDRIIRLEERVLSMTEMLKEIRDTLRQNQQ